MRALRRWIEPDRLAWVWLAAGFALLPFTAWQTVVPLAGWLAPVFLLRFARTTRRSWLTGPCIFLAFVGSIMVAVRGTPFNPLGFLGNVLFKGWVWALPYAADHHLGRRRRGWTRTLVFPLAGVVAEWGVSLTRISSSGSIAYSQAGNLALLQLLSITGMSGVTFLVMWCASIANELWERGFQWRSVRGQLAVFAGVLAAVLLFGTLRLEFASPSSKTAPMATIAIDRGISRDAVASIDWAARNWSTDAQRAALSSRLQPTVRQMLARTETALRGGAKVVGWQESGAWTLEEDQPGLVERAATLARQHDAYLLLAMEVLTRTTDLRVLRNESILIDPSGSVRWTYDKAHPSPYDEAFATIAGPATLPLAQTRYGRMGVAICYDSYYPALVRQAGIGDADILYEPANDSRPFAGSAAAMACCRAIENGCSVLRPTGNGVSAMIDSLGRFVAVQDYFTDDTGVMIASLPIRGVRTIYRRTGDLFVYLCAAGLAGLAGSVLISRGSSRDGCRVRPASAGSSGRKTSRTLARPRA
jgi:apolipoprotein N-acyltransferase